MAGKSRGKTGKVVCALPKENKIVVEGVNICKRNTRPKKQGQKGQVVQKPMPFSVSSAMIICPACGKAVRVGKKTTGDKRGRICKKCGADIA